MFKFCKPQFLTGKTGIITIIIITITTPKTKAVSSFREYISQKKYIKNEDCDFKVSLSD